MQGPIDYIVVGFEGNKFNGNILRAISEAIDRGTIGLIALSLIQVTADGTVKILNIADADDEEVRKFAKRYQYDNSPVTKEDLAEIAELVEANTSVGLLVIEQLWAKPLKKALIEANGVLVAEGRIHPDAAAELNREEY